jgi:hypothetical protein
VPRRFHVAVAFLVATYGCTSSGDDGGNGAPSDDGGHADASLDGRAPDAPADGAAGDAAQQAQDATGSDGNPTGDAHDTTDAAGSDGDGCATAASACSLATDAGAVNGLVSCGACAPCVDPDDDLACTSAYGASDAGADGGPAPYICNGGSCTPGNCHADGDCMPAGLICGIQKPNTCGPCTSDADCKNDSDYQGQGLTLCNIAMGTCQVTDCNVADGVACMQNPADVCCSQSCYTGNCCTDAQCSGATPHCVKHKCGL